MILWFSFGAAVSRRTGGARLGTNEMYDQRLFLNTLSRFAMVLPARYDLEAALGELTASATSVLGLCGSGVTMTDDGRLRFVTTVTDASAQLERDHAKLHPCPCRDAYATGEVVRVTDLREEPRVVIEQAKGITAHQHSFTVDQAYQYIRRHARNNNASLRKVAEAIVAVGLQV